MNAGIKISVTTRKKPDYIGTYSTSTRIFTFIEEKEYCYLVKDQTGMERIVSKNDEYFDLISVEFTK